MAKLEQYRKENGFYDTERIMIDAGMDNTAALFADIFGGTGDDSSVTDLSPEWQAIYDEATRLNNEMLTEMQQEKESEARQIMSQPTPWTRNQWVRLQALGYAWTDTDEYARHEAGLTQNGEILFSQITEESMNARKIVVTFEPRIIDLEDGTPPYRHLHPDEIAFVNMEPITGQAGAIIDAARSTKQHEWVDHPVLGKIRVHMRDYENRTPNSLQYVEITLAPEAV